MANTIGWSKKAERGFKTWLYSLSPEQLSLMSPEHLREWIKQYKDATT